MQGVPGKYCLGLTGHGGGGQRDGGVPDRLSVGLPHLGEPLVPSSGREARGKIES